VNIYFLRGVGWRLLDLASAMDGTEDGGAVGGGRWTVDGGSFSGQGKGLWRLSGV
jgi:hypothetical protein